MRLNALGQPIGDDLAGWTPPPRPPRQPLAGRFCRLEPLDGSIHTADLFAASALDRDGRTWTYLPVGPFDSLEAYTSWVESSSASTDPLFFAIIDARSGRAAGVASYLRITPGSGTIEIGHLHFSPALQRTPAATEALYLLIARAFALGYRRCEWKCDALNEPSRRAADRLGFTFEGVFRQATVYKGRSRDTAWYAIVDRDWPAIERGFRRWLDPANFDPAGRQRAALGSLIADERQ